MAEIKRRVYLLDFTGDDELDELTIKCRGASLDFILSMGAQLEAATELQGAEDQESGLKAMGLIREMTEAYASVLISWDLTEGGVEIPATAAGLRTLDLAQLMRVIQAWQRAVMNVELPLAQRSADGEPSEALSLPMEPLSASRAS